MPDNPSAKRISTFSELFPPKPLWTSQNVPDLTGQTIIVTGGSSGIGLELCKVLLSRNAKVYMAARDETKVDVAIDQLKESLGRQATRLSFLKLDLADLRSVRRAAEEFLSKEQELHVLFNNGGVMFPPLEELTEQQFDSQWGTNVLGHFFLTNLLLPALKRAATTSPSKSARVVSIASSLHGLYLVPNSIDWDSLKKGTSAFSARKKLGLDKLYGQSKLGVILFANELARRYEGDGIVSSSLHPGGVKTRLQRNMNPLVVSILNVLLFYNVSYGAITPLYAGTAPETANMNGEYFTAWARRSLPSRDAQNVELMGKVWTWCEEQVKGF
ncbi:hypothetical protein EW146_g7938 [Bondarzewia mesenterica]|uniref:NAD(P)-binding protein n=1 Tax=Bondarzewia mesenterica TaxID=1095465 RepID=A0A4V6S1C1_9AGAM|nr:hypothetical protein EW146_g7938 [Bondarzewia mesenterica]